MLATHLFNEFVQRREYITSMHMHCNTHAGKTTPKPNVVFWR